MADADARKWLPGAALSWWRAVDRGWQAVAIGAAVTAAVRFGLSIPW